MLIILVKRYHLGAEKVMCTQDIKLRGENFMENKSKSSIIYQGKIPGKSNTHSHSGRWVKT